MARDTRGEGQDTVEVVEVSREQRQAVEDARDAMHSAVLAILKTEGLSGLDRDLSELAESIALEGYFEL